MRALEQLWQISRDYQNLADRIDRLQPQKWLEENPDSLDALVDEITCARVAQHKILTHPDMAGLLKRAKSTAKTTKDEMLVKSMHRLSSLATGISEKDIVDLETAAAHSEQDWLDSFKHLETGTATDVFKAQFAPLEHIFALRRSQFARIAEQTGMKPSEIAVDEWNPFMRNDDIDELFTEIQKNYPQIIRALKTAADEHPVPDNPFTRPEIKRKFSEEKQLAFFKDIQEKMLCAAGWTPEKRAAHGITLHGPDFLPNPFCWGDRKDIWMSIENRGNDFFVGLGNTLHETAHMLYLLSLNECDPQIIGTPLGQVNGYGIHEVAAMYFEQLGAEPKFWELLSPLIERHFDVSGSEWEPENLRMLMNLPSFENMAWGTSEAALMPNMYFRTMAERKILDGEMEASELPDFWAKTMTDLTGAPHKAENFYVDESHWFDRQTGYFPAYWIGVLCGAKMHDMVDTNAAEKASDLDEYFGIYHEMIDRRIFRHAATKTPLELIKNELGGSPASFTGLYVDRLLRIADKTEAAPQISKPVHSRDLQASLS